MRSGQQLCLQPLPLYIDCVNQSQPDFKPLLKMHRGSLQSTPYHDYINNVLVYTIMLTLRRRLGNCSHSLGDLDKGSNFWRKHANNITTNDNIGYD